MIPLYDLMVSESQGWESSSTGWFWFRISRAGGCIIRGPEWGGRGCSCDGAAPLPCPQTWGWLPPENAIQGERHGAFLDPTSGVTHGSSSTFYSLETRSSVQPALKGRGMKLPFWNKWVSENVPTCFKAATSPFPGGKPAGLWCGQVLDIRQAYNWGLGWFVLLPIKLKAPSVSQMIKLLSQLQRKH